MHKNKSKTLVNNTVAKFGFLLDLFGAKCYNDRTNTISMIGVFSVYILLIRKLLRKPDILPDSICDKLHSKKINKIYQNFFKGGYLQDD